MTRAAFAFALALALSAPVAAGSPATKHVRGIVGTGLPTTGGTMTGNLSLGANHLELWDSGEYIYSSANNTLNFVAGGGNSLTIGTAKVTFSISLDMGALHAYSSSGILELGGNVTSARGNGTGAVGTSGNLEVQGALQVAGTMAKYTTKGAATWVRTQTDSVTFANDASKTATGIIVDGAFMVGTSGRVTTSLAGCTSVHVGRAADTDMFKANLAVAAGSTFTNADATAAFSTMPSGAFPSTAAQNIVVTAVGGNCTAGVVALTVHYIDVTAATAN